MKTRTFVSTLILVLAVLIIAGSCATKRKAISYEDFIKAWSGTWINMEYGGKVAQKITLQPDGTREGFGISTSTTATFQDEVTTLETWLDSKGTIWYKAKWVNILPVGAKGYEMGKISDSGTIYEFVYASEDFPIEEWEPDRFEYNYLIYYRQE